MEQLNTSTMNSHVDGRLVNFIERSRSDATALASVIQSRQKFPDDKFVKVQEAFPVIIAMMLRLTFESRPRPKGA